MSNHTLCDIRMSTAYASAIRIHLCPCPWRISTVSRFNAMSHCYTEAKQQFASHAIWMSLILKLFASDIIFANHSHWGTIEF